MNGSRIRGVWGSAAACLWCMVFFAPPVLHAAILSVESSAGTIGIDDQFAVTIMLDAEGDDVNAIEGTLIFPNDLVHPTRISDGDSIIDLWITRPQFSDDGTIPFAGIVPGGFSGVRAPLAVSLEPGKVIEIVFDAKSEGVGEIAVRDLRVLRNDGRGTEVEVTMQPRMFEVLPTRGGDAAVGIEETEAGVQDTEPPDPFDITIGQQREVFEGRYFIAFSTTDAGSGIHRYEVCETRSVHEDACASRWKEAESPYVLEDQSLSSTIRVRAFDNNGNVRVAEYITDHRHLPENRTSQYLFALGALLIMCIVYGVSLLIRKIFS